MLRKSVYVLGLLALGAAGDWTYRTTTAPKPITQAQAICFAQCAASAGVWDGALADMEEIRVRRDDGAPTGYSAECVGTKKSAPADVPPGARLVEKE